jgi:ATP-dependent Clp endopeptidase proteolytic subunit ClpP
MALTLACFLLLLLAVQGLQLKSGLNARVSTKTFMAGGQVPYVPYYPSKSSKDYQWMDIYNALGRERTLFVSRYLDNESCNQLIASLIWLQGQSDTEPITMYFNVPGAMNKPSLAVFDIMSRMKCPIITVNTGLTVGMGALLCAAGTRGKRFAMPNARFLMSRSGMDDGIEGQAVDIHLQVMEVRQYACRLCTAAQRCAQSHMWCGSL